MSQARRFAATIRLSNQDNIKLSPYLWWILAEERLATDLRNREQFEYLKTSPGIVVWLNNLPIYVLAKTENLGWKIGLPSKCPHDLLNLGLATSRELGHYCLESEYMGEFARRSENPQTIIAKLIHLQRHVQKD